jgi:hypothetical protein
MLGVKVPQFSSRDQERDGAEHLDLAEPNIPQGPVVELDDQRTGLQRPHRRVDQVGAA